jgi:hypothetical protein
MSRQNPLWGAPRIHGELLKLGFEVAESTVSKYMIRYRGPPSQSWRTFLHNHAHAIAAIDLCVVPTVTFERLFAFLVIGHSRRQLLWFAVTRHPTAEWLAQQIVEAFPWDTVPTYLIRDNDCSYGDTFTARLRAMGIRDRPDWDVAARLSGSRRDLWRSAFARRSDRLLELLQRGAHASRIVEGYSPTPSRPKIRSYRRRANPVRATPSLRADMIFGRDSGSG